MNAKKTFLAMCVLSMLFSQSLSVTEIFASDTYKWKMTSFFGSGRSQNDILKQVIEKVQARTDGAVQITLYENTLGHARDHWDMLEKGAIQMAYLAEGYAQGRMPVGCLLNLPFELSELNLIYDLYGEWMKAGYLTEVTDHFKVLFYRPTTPQNLFLRNKKITKMEDFKGLKIRTLQGMMGRTLSTLGAAPVSMPGPEVYMSMSTGVIDGLVTGPDYILELKINEVSKYGLRVPIYTGIWIAAVNKKAWDKLPENHKIIIEEVSHEVFSNDRAKAEADDRAYWDKITNETTLKIDTISQEEKDRWKKATSHIANEYLTEWSAKGYPVKEAYKMMQEKEKMQK